MAVTNRLPARFTLAHGLMVLAGVLTFVLVSSALRDNSETVAVVYAGERSQAGLIAPVLTEISTKTPGIENFATERDIAGKVLVRSLEEGSPILTADLIDADRRNFRIFAVPVDAYHVEALRLQSNDRVDIIGFDADGIATYVATGLPIEGTSAVTTDGFATTNESFITVQVSDADALRMAEAMREGPLHVVRNTGSALITSVDNADVDEESIDAEPEEAGQP